MKTILLFFALIISSFIYSQDSASTFVMKFGKDSVFGTYESRITSQYDEYGDKIEGFDRIHNQFSVNIGAVFNL